MQANLPDLLDYDHDMPIILELIDREKHRFDPRFRYGGEYRGVDPGPVPPSQKIPPIREIPRRFTPEELEEIFRDWDLDDPYYGDPRLA